VNTYARERVVFRVGARADRIALLEGHLRHDVASRINKATSDFWQRAFSGGGKSIPN
jgi:hypothetical protein